MKKLYLFSLVNFMFYITGFAQTVTDIDGNVYHSIVLGSQNWIKENLETTHFNNGDAIPTSLLQVNNDSTSLYQWFYNEDSLLLPEYGRLYTWYATVDSRNLCPAGWHVPSDNDWIELANFLGGDSIAGDKMKESGTTHWSNTSSGVSNSSDFTALPGGFRGNSTLFLNINSMATFWSSTAWGSSVFQRAITYNLQSINSVLSLSVAVANCGLSVRCVQNTTSGTENLFHDDGIGIYPNPATNVVNIIIGKPQTCRFMIYDLSGKLILQKTISERTNNVDLHSLSKGVYLIKVENSKSGTQQKLIIE